MVVELFFWGELESTDPEKLKTMQMLQWSDMNIPDRVSKCEQLIAILTNKIQFTLEKLESDFSSQPAGLSTLDPSIG